jgi:hypothetical protein
MPYIDNGRVSLFFDDARSGGTQVLLLNELGCTSESWREVVPLASADRRVVAVDIRCAPARKNHLALSRQAALPTTSTCSCGRSA